MGNILCKTLTVFLIEFNLKMNSVFCVVFSQTNDLSVSFIHYLIEVFLVIFCPFPYRQLFHMNDAWPRLIKLYFSLDLELPALDLVNFSMITFVPRLKFGKLFIMLQFLSDHFRDFSRVEVGNKGTPP